MDYRPSPQDIGRHRAKKVQWALTDAEVDELYRGMKTSWDSSSCAAQVRDFLRTEILPRKDIEIDQVVVLGLSSPTLFEPTGAGKDRNEGRSMAQFVALEDWVRTLRERFSIRRVILLDPVFVRSDEEFFAQRGCEVAPVRLDRRDTLPEGLLTPTTFVFSPYVDIYVEHEMLRSMPPRLWVNADISGGDPIPLPGCDTQDFTKFLATSSSWRLPVYEENRHAFWKLHLYYPMKPSESFGGRIVAHVNHVIRHK